MIRKSMKRGIAIIIALLLVIGCEKVEIPTSEGGGGGGDVPTEEPDVEIEGTGEGSMEKPFSVMDLLEGENAQQGRQCWVMGYVVGYTRYSMKNANFTADGAVQSNVLLADDPEEEDANWCVPIELNTDRLHKNISLAYHPDSLGRRIMIEGLVMDYFKVPGLRQVKEFRWLGGFVIPGEEGGDNPPPSEEEEDPMPEPDKPEGPDKDTIDLEIEGELITGGRIAKSSDELYRTRRIRR